MFYLVLRRQRGSQQYDIINHLYVHFTVTTENTAFNLTLHLSKRNSVQSSHAALPLQVLNFVRVAVQSRKVNLLAIDRDRAHTQVIDLPVDSHLQEFTVSVSGDNPSVSLWDPRGTA